MPPSTVTCFAYNRAIHHYGKDSVGFGLSTTDSERISTSSQPDQWDKMSLQAITPGRVKYKVAAELS